MEEKEHYMYCVESLTVVSWMFYVFPYILKRIRDISKGAEKSGQKIGFLIYYLKASKGGLFWARLTLLNINATLAPLEFSLVDVKDENGDLLWWKALCDDSMVIQKYIRAQPEFQNIIGHHGGENRIPQFLVRHIMCPDSTYPDVLILPKMLFLIRVVSSPYYRRKECLENTLFFSSQKQWLDEVAKFAVKQNVKIISIKKVGFDVRRFVLKFDAIKYCIKRILYYWMTIKYGVRQILSFKISRRADDVPGKVNNTLKTASPKIAVEYYGHLNLCSPDLNSDLFFCQQSNVPREDVLIYFQHSIFPGTNAKWKEIKDFGMSAVVINSRAASTPHIPVFREPPLGARFLRHRSQETKIYSSQDMGCSRDSKFIRRNLHQLLKNYQKKYDFWVNFITQHNIKMHVSWYKHDAKEYAMWDALQNTGGVGIIYQRSFEGAPTPWSSAAPDVAFGFSKLGAQPGKDMESIIPYYVITGYLGDHRFPLVRKTANNIRDCLLNRGAKRIITYFDENSVDDQRWNVGHHATQENYSYLLNKVLEVPWLGLVVKPKVISDLRRRLGDVADLLGRAVKTGRCFIFEQGHVVGLHPPATAALAADIAIHGHFFAATAGMESALTGTKTLLLDREGYSISPIYRLGIGRVIFKNWEDLWNACQDYWNSSEAMPEFGDWSSMIDEIDPFRDGRAAERMGTYLEWLLEGFKANLPRETALADAAERYARIWGKDKILSINCNPKTQECFSVR